MNIKSFVQNPEAHAVALLADGFKEQRPKQRLSSWPTRCFKKLHKGGLLTETQNVDMSRPPLNLSGSHQALVVVDLKLNQKVLKRLAEEVSKIRAPNPNNPSALIAILSEHKSSIETITKYAPHFKNDALVNKLLSSVSSLPVSVTTGQSPRNL